MNYDDYAALKHEERVRREMLEHTKILNELCLQIPKSDQVREAIIHLHIKIQNWEL